MNMPNLRTARRGFAVLGILCASLMLRADGCLVEEKIVDGVATFVITHTWVSEGFTEANFSDTYTLTSDDIDAIDDAINGLDNVDSFGEPAVAGATYRVLTSTGHDARRAGSVTIGGETLLTFDIPTNAAGTNGAAGDGTLTLDAAGIDEVKAAIQAFLDGNSSALDGLTFAANWSSTPAPTQQDQDNFTWVTELVVQIPVTFKFDGPS